MRLLIESLRGVSHERVESDQVLVRQPTAQIGTLAFGKAVYDQRRNLGLSVVDLTGRAGMALMRSSASRRAAPNPPSPCCAA
jgi:hypothetical protein